MTKARYLYKLRPGRQAQAALRAEYGKARWIWNQCVDQYRSGNKPTTAKLDKMLTSARAQFSWVRDGSSVVQQQVIREYGAALNASFKVPGRGRPGYKSLKKSPYVSLNYTKSGFRLSSDERPVLRLAGGVSIPVVWSRDLPSAPSSVRVYEDAAGWWWASFVVEVPDQKAPKHPHPDKAVGIDWGIITTATASKEEFDLPYRKTSQEQADTVLKYQRRMARNSRAKSDERKKAYQRDRKRAARAHRRARWQRQEHARAWARQVALENGKIAIEDFRPKFLAKTTMAKKMHSTAIGQLKRELIAAATKTGSEVVLVNPAYTSMTCSSCGTRAKYRTPLAERTFICHTCGYVGCRDRNAALVILDQAGFNLTLHDGQKTLVPSGS